MTKNFNILVDKLNSFKLKYYSYKLVKGFILTLFILLLVYTTFSLVEYWVYLSSDIRKALFYGFTIFGSLLFIQFVGIPLLKLVRIIKPIDIKSASLIIQNNFTEIKDKLLNIIELSSIQKNEYSNDIVLASIDQKIDELKLFDFNDAVKFKSLRVILLFLLVSVGIMLSIFVVNKNIFTESTERIIHYNTEYVKPAPYSFHLLNSDLKAKKGDSFTWKVNCEGDEIPQMVYINIEGNNYLMKNSASGQFEFEMASVINPVSFYFTDLKYSSDKYKLQLLPKPGLTQFSVNLYPPSYTGLQNQTLQNIGDLQVPAGSRIEWIFKGIDVDSLYLLLDDSVRIDAVKQNNMFHVESNFYTSASYSVFIQNKITKPELALSYGIEVITDLFPEIEIAQVKDSFQLTRYFFKGVIGDDYGFTGLKFHYNIDNADSSIAIPFVKTLTDQDFYFSFDFNDLNQPSGLVTYYFSVTDNDLINHYKTTTSDSYTFKFPDKEEIAETEKEQFKNIQDKIKQSREMAKDIQSDLDNLRLKNMDSNTSDWEKSQMVSDIISKQSKLEQLYDDIKHENENLNKYLNSFNKQNDDVIKKQKEIEELLDDVFTDELKQLMEEFNKLAEKFDPKKMNQLAEKMDLSYDDLQKQLDRNLEMLRKLKVEQKIQEIIDKVNEKAIVEEKLSQQVMEEKNYEKAFQDISQDQKDMERMKEELKDALELNKELNKPLNFDDFNEEFDDINKNMEDNMSELEKRNRRKSSEGIQNTSEKLKNMAFGMQQMLDMNTSKQNMENIENLKQILSNLITLSFSQEDVLNKLTQIDPNDPSLTQLNRHQKRIVDQSNVVKDSLYALAMRTPQITSMVNNELLSMEINLVKAFEQMEEAKFPQSRVSQQFVITSVNNLALMLNEALDNLEKQMANQMPGDQECEKPGGNGKPQMNLLKKASQSIKEQLQRMIEQMKNGNQQQMSKELGQMLMQHEMMQQMLREMINNGGVGSSAKNQLQQIDRLLEQNRRELMSKSVDAQTIARQNLISTRLLKAENAERERDYDDKRESETAKEFYSNPAKFFEYKEKENYSIEYLNKNSHKLTNFYNYKYKQYLNNMEK